MLLPSFRRTHRATHRVLVALVAASLLSMPVTYRGGAEAAHAHTIFQLWADVRMGSFDHHGPAAHHRRPTTSRHERTVAMDAAGEPAAEHPAMRGAAMGPTRADGRDVPTIGVAEDGPTASSAFTPDVRGTVLALTPPPSLDAAASFAPAVERPSRLVGIVLAPSIPPPR